MAVRKRNGIGFLDTVLGRKKGRRLVEKSNRATAVDVDRFKETSGVGQDWAKTVYGDYYATSVPIYAAIKIRSDALARPPVAVFRQEPSSPTLLPMGEGWQRPS